MKTKIIIEVESDYYDNPEQAAEYFNVHPVSIRRWCKENINNWSYV